MGVYYQLTFLCNMCVRVISQSFTMITFEVKEISLKNLKYFVCLHKWHDHCFSLCIYELIMLAMNCTREEFTGIDWLRILQPWLRMTFLSWCMQYKHFYLFCDTCTIWDCRLRRSVDQQWIVNGVQQIRYVCMMEWILQSARRMILMVSYAMVSKRFCVFVT